MKVFFSWQSDLPEEKKYIRNILQEICDELDIEYDEDTRDTGSAEFVTDILLRKIKNSSVFIADLTTVGESQEGKKLSNPNVCFELGFAECHLGREQIVITYNENRTGFDDLPFDLSKRNSVRFTIPSPDKQSKLYKKLLLKAVTNALESAKKSHQTHQAGDKPPNKFEKTLLYWGLSRGEGLISEAWDKEEGTRLLDRKALSVGDNRFWYESDVFFYKRHDSRAAALFTGALNSLLKRDFLNPVEERLLGSSDGRAWAITEEGEAVARQINESDVYPMVTKSTNKKPTA